MSELRCTSCGECAVEDNVIFAEFPEDRSRVVCNACPDNPELRWRCKYCKCWEQLSTTVVCTMCIENTATSRTCNETKWRTAHSSVAICGTRHFGCEEKLCADFVRCFYTEAKLLVHNKQTSCTLYRLKTNLCKKGSLYVRVYPDVPQEFFRLSKSIATMPDGTEVYKLVSQSAQGEEECICLRKLPDGRHEVLSNE